VQGRPGDSISDFNRRLDILGRTRSTRRASVPLIGGRVPRPGSPIRPAALSARSYAPPRRVSRALPMSPAARRRRDVFVLLLAVVGVSFLAAIFASGWFWALHLLADAALGAYVALLVRLRNVAAQRKLAYPPLRAINSDGVRPSSSESRLHLVRAASR
jgi:hypothetical protein